MTQQRTAVVVSAHTGDFVWRAGGAIALHAERGWDVLIVCLSFGERGESARMWQEEKTTLAAVREARRSEAVKAANVLGARIEFFDLGDYPLRVDQVNLFRLAGIYRQLQPDFILTHSRSDPYNFDHPLACHVAQEARIIAQAQGHEPSRRPVLGAPPVYLFEPHQPEQCGWTPEVLLDISPVWKRKMEAFRVLAAQEHLWEYYERVALQRGSQGTRNSNKKMVYGEAYQRVFPTVTDTLA
jgi:4-oxalomesaconate hydratase